VWVANQSAVEKTHIARLATEAELPVTARVRVVVPAAVSGPGSALWTGETQAVELQSGWAPSVGAVRVKTRPEVELQRGDVVELHGWLQRPRGPENPGGMGTRAMLAADRVFAEIRVPRANGVVFVSHGTGGERWLERARAYLRGKLLEHTVHEDVEAGYAMEALLLGVREPVIDPVTRAFSQAGVAHLLAISGAHVVFVAGCVWLLLRAAPISPRWREVLVAAAVLAYVLATPCGPPVVRAAVGVVMVVIARLLGRPRVTMNILAAAMIVVLLWRPADVLDAGFQLSFVGTAALIVFAERVYAGVFGAWLEREQALAGLAGTRWAAVRMRARRVACRLLVANGIGVAATMPLVAVHFGKINPLGVVTGILALPAVAAAMVASAVQVGVEVISSTLGAWLAPATVLAGRGMVWVVAHLAMLPGSAVSVRAPVWWVVACVYGVWAIWALRRQMGVTRAVVVNGTVGACVVGMGWYAVTMPRGELQIEVLRVGIGSAMVVRMPDGAVWVVDAGSREVMRPMDRAIAPALRVEGIDRLHGVLLTALDEVHARDAGPVIATYRPAAVVVPATAWKIREWTRAGGAVEAATSRITTVGTGEGMEINDVRVVMAAEGVFVWEFAGRRVVTADGKAVGGLWRWSQGGESCDAMIVTGAEGKGMADALERIQAPIVRAGNVVRVNGNGVSVKAF
jgi:competence protein ComEC